MIARRKTSNGAKIAVLKLDSPKKFKAKRISAAISLFLATLFSILAFAQVGVAGLSFADGNEDMQNKVGEVGTAYADGKTGQEGFEETFDKYLKNPWAVNDSKNTFPYLFKRILTPGYLNETPTSIVQHDGKDKDYWCNVNDSNAGTAAYHNCDVPNIMTQFLQSVISIPWSNTDSATVSNSKVENPWFGLPDSIPDNNVPVNAQERSVKYTALELYGYNLKYSSYNGEWDNIQVMTAARAMANFGLMDNIKLGVSTLINGIGAGISDSLGSAWEQLRQGNLIGSIGGMFTGIFEGGITGSINTILDSSDANVFETGAWYRVGYGATVYNGGRELTNAEISAILQKKLLDYISEQYPDKVKIPEDLVSVKTLPPPLDEKGICEAAPVTNGETGTFVKIHSVDNKKDCLALASSYKTVKWTVTQEGQTLSQWKSANSGKLAIGDNYGITCELNTSGDKNSEWTKFNACWTDQWKTAYDKAIEAAQQDVLEDFINKKILDPVKIMESMKKRNFNTPEARYVCSEIGDLTPTYVFKENKELTGDCGVMRPPIQNGYFGNGAVDSAGGTPKTDTRWGTISVTPSIIVPFSPISFISSFGLGTSVFLTQISNTLINLSFAPLMEAIGLDKIVVALIEGLRDSLFFPLAIMVIAISAFWQMITTFKSKNYNQGIISILLIAATFILGVFLMYKPANLVKLIDEVPSQIEVAILGSIYSFDAETDPICDASSTSSGSATDLNGNSLPYNPNDSVRVMMCQVWQVFAFTPWVYGQFGTGYQDLNTSEMKNTNGELVGKASVNLGGGNVVENWALYQLEVTSSGTSTTVNPKDVPGRVDSDFYRLVDLQAGPNEGIASDARYFGTWSGANWFGRLIVAVLSPIVAIFGLVAIGTFTIAKIVISLKVLILLTIMPIMFLIGLHPTKGRGQLKKYGMTIFGLMIQRILMTLFLAVFFKILLAFSLGGQSYFIIAFITVVVCIMFLIYKDELLNLVTAGMDTSFGGNQVDPKSMLSQVGPKSLRNYAMQTKSAASGLLSGSVGGFLAGGIKGASKGARKSMEITRNRTRSMQRRKGFGAIQGANYAADEALKDIKTDLKSGNYDKVRSDLNNLEADPKPSTRPGEFADGFVGDDLSKRTQSFERAPDISPKEAKLLRKLKELEQKDSEFKKGVASSEYGEIANENNDDLRVRRFVDDSTSKNQDLKNPSNGGKPLKLTDYQEILNGLREDSSGKNKKD